MTTVSIKICSRKQADFVKKWLSQNVDEGYWDYVNWGGDIEIFFVREQDAVMFSLICL